MTDHEWCEAFVGGELEGVGQSVQQTVAVLEAKLREVRLEEAKWWKDRTIPLGVTHSVLNEHINGLNHPTPPSGLEG